MEDPDLIKVAKKRVEDKKGFYGNLVAFACTMPFLVFINWMLSPEFLWVVFPFFGWGIGIVMHYFTVFGFMGKNSEWEQKAVQKELSKIKGQIKGKAQLELRDEDRLELKETQRIQQEESWDDQEIV